MGAALSSVPLCARAGGAATDDNNNVEDEPDNNNADVIVACQPQPVVTSSDPAPVETSTPKMERDLERDLGDGAADPDSLDFGPVSDKTYGSDSGLEHSSDELELSRYVVDDDYLDTVLDSDEDEEEDTHDEETHESLESGDLGIDRTKTFRVTKSEAEETEDEDDKHKMMKDTDDISRKVPDIDSAPALSSRLSELEIRDSYSERS